MMPLTEDERQEVQALIREATMSVVRLGESEHKGGVDDPDRDRINP